MEPIDPYVAPGGTPTNTPLPSFLRESLWEMARMFQRAAWGAVDANDHPEPDESPGG